MRRAMFITVALLCRFWPEAVLAQPTCTLNVSPGSGVAPLGVTASGLCTSPENNITQVFLDWGDGTKTFVNPGFTVTHKFSSSGSFNVVLTAFDSFGLSGSASQTVHASPPLQCSPQATPASGKAPVAVTVNANCTDPAGTP